MMKDTSRQSITARMSHSGARLAYGFALLLFVVGSDLNIVAPLLSQIRASFGVTLAAAGLLVTVFTAGYTLASPFIGSLTDRLGRKTVLYAGIVAFIVFDVISARAPNFAILLVGRALGGLAAVAISPTAYTIIGDAVAYGERGRVMSIASVGFSVSAVAGVPIGLWLSGYWGWRGVFWVLAAATITAAGLLTLALGAPSAQQGAKPQAQARESSIGAIRRIFAATGSVLIVSFLGFAVVGLVYTYLVIDLKNVWHWSKAIIVGFLCLYGIANVVGNLVLGRLGDSWGKGRAVRIGQVVEFIALLSIASASFWRWNCLLVLGLTLFALGQAYIPNLKAMASEVAPELRGRSQAWNNAAMYGGMMVGSWTASYGYQVIGFSGLAIAAAVLVALGWGVARATAQETP